MDSEAEELQNIRFERERIFNSLRYEYEEINRWNRHLEIFHWTVFAGQISITAAVFKIAFDLTVCQFLKDIIIIGLGFASIITWYWFVAYSNDVILTIECYLKRCLEIETLLPIQFITGLKASKIKIDETREKDEEMPMKLSAFDSILISWIKSINFFSFMTNFAILICIIWTSIIVFHFVNLWNLYKYYSLHCYCCY